MVAARLNYTNHIQIEEHEIEATYQLENGGCVLTLRWLLGHYSFPEDSFLFLEVKGGSQTSESHRVELGQLGQGNGDMTLSPLFVRNPELIKLRFGVVGQEPNGLRLIMADRDRISPTNLNENSQARSFLKMVKISDLVVPWMLDFNDDEPVLLISDRQELFHKLRDTSPIFKPLILSEVVRQVFVWICSSDLDLQGRILRNWLSLFERLSCPKSFFEVERSLENPEDLKEIEEKAIVVSEEFSKKFDLINSIASSFENEGD
jgi:hypothetical protein